MADRYPPRPPRYGDRPGGDRPAGDRPRPPYRPSGDSGGGDSHPRPPFRPPGPDSGDARPRAPFRGPEPAPVHSIRLRDGDREVDVSGSPLFIRQMLDELPALLARLRGEGPSGPAALRMPAAPAAERPSPFTEVAADPMTSTEVIEEPPARMRATSKRTATTRRTTVASSNGGANGHVSERELEKRILAVLRSENRAMPVSEIRARLNDDTSGQMVRRILERAPDRVAVKGERPAVYRLR